MTAMGQVSTPHLCPGSIDLKTKQPHDYQHYSTSKTTTMLYQHNHQYIKALLVSRRIHDFHSPHKISCWWMDAVPSPCFIVPWETPDILQFSLPSSILSRGGRQSARSLASRRSLLLQYSLISSSKAVHTIHWLPSPPIILSSNLRNQQEGPSPSSHLEINPAALQDPKTKYLDLL